VLGVSIVPVGSPAAPLLEELREFLARSFVCDCRVSPVALDPDFAYDAARGQHNARPLIHALEHDLEPHTRLLLGVADVDLFSPLFTYVFGEAQLGGRVGIFSLHRLHPAHYGLPEDPRVVAARARKEALHESGHLLGLVHCRYRDCAMRFSGAAEEVDLKPDRFCPACTRAAAAGWALPDRGRSQGTDQGAPTR